MAGQLSQLSQLPLSLKNSSIRQRMARLYVWSEAVGFCEVHVSPVRVAICPARRQRDFEHVPGHSLMLDASPLEKRLQQQKGISPEQAFN